MKTDFTKFLFCILCVLLVVGCATTLTPEQQAAQDADKAAIERVIAFYVQAIRENNPDALFALCADDVVLYSAIKPKKSVI